MHIHSPAFGDILALLPERLKKSCRVRVDLCAADLTTIGLGDIRPVLIEAESLEVLQELWAQLRSAPVRSRILGFGSNVLLSSASAETVFVRLGKEFAGYEFIGKERDITFDDFANRAVVADRTDGGDLLLVKAGSSLMSLSRDLCRAGFSGLEFAAGIPASVGGAVKMNAGAHGGAMSDIIEAVHLLTAEGSFRTVPRAAIKFTYRHSPLPEDAIILGATLRLTRGEPAQIQRLRSEFLEHRRRTQPLHLPSVGSVFKNIQEPYGVLHAGRLLEEVGMKGFSLGGVQYSELHANWIVRCKDSGRVEEVMQLIQLGQARVVERFGKTLEPEVHLW